MSFAVLGAGVVGFSTALELQDKYANAKVTIIADKFGADTTSDVAAGIFRPGPSFSGPNDAITKFVFIFNLITFLTVVNVVVVIKLTNSYKYGNSPG